MYASGLNGCVRTNTLAGACETRQVQVFPAAARDPPCLRAAASASRDTDNAPRRLALQFSRF